MGVLCATDSGRVIALFPLNNCIMTIESLKTGETFTRKPGAKKVYERGAYCRINKAYECTNYEDINDFIYIKKGKQVYESN